MLKAYPQLDTEKFWEDKWKIMYPNEPYPTFLSNRDKFLVAERGNFVLLLNAYPCHECGRGYFYRDIIYENNDLLKENLEKYSEDPSNIKILPINVKKRFHIIKDYNDIIAGQFDTGSDAEDHIENNILNIEIFLLIDIGNLVFCFSDVKMEHKVTNSESYHKYYSGTFKRKF